MVYQNIEIELYVWIDLKISFRWGHYKLELSYWLIQFDSNSLRLTHIYLLNVPKPVWPTDPGSDLRSNVAIGQEIKCKLMAMKVTDPDLTTLHLLSDVPRRHQ